jgi:CheY-like chemotaxis protein
MEKIALLVDDDYVTNYLIKNSLERMGIFKHVATAESGEKALELLNAYLQYALPLPDLILLDLKMPNMNGFDFLEAFNELGVKKKVEIVISSASDYPEDLKRVKELGIEHYLLKPWPISKITSLIDQLQLGRV